jgi:hypothetical protein
VAATIYSRRVQTLKERINKKEPSFQTVYSAFDELMGCKRLSRHNIIWARKQLIRFRDTWPDDDAKRLLDKLELRVEHAAAKWQKRDDERAAKRLLSGGKRAKKDKQPTAAPEAPPPSIDPWEV